MKNLGFPFNSGHDWLLNCLRTHSVGRGLPSLEKMSPLSPWDRMATMVMSEPLWSWCWANELISRYISS